MKSSFRIVFSLILALLFLVSCGGWNVTKTRSSAHFKPEVFKDPNDVIVYFYCFEGEPGDKLPMNILLDGKKVAEVVIGAYTFVHTTPGAHVITFEKPALLKWNKSVEINPEANQTLVFKVTGGFFKMVESMDAQQGFYEINEMKEQRFNNYSK